MAQARGGGVVAAGGDDVGGRDAFGHISYT